MSLVNNRAHSGLTVVQLKDHLRSNHLKVSGVKIELIRRLNNFLELQEQLEKKAISKKAKKRWESRHNKKKKEEKESKLNKQKVLLFFFWRIEPLFFCCLLCCFFLCLGSMIVVFEFNTSCFLLFFFSSCFISSFSLSHDQRCVLFSPLVLFLAVVLTFFLFCFVVFYFFFFFCKDVAKQFNLNLHPKNALHRHPKN